MFGKLERSKQTGKAEKSSLGKAVVCYCPIIVSELGVQKKKPRNSKAEAVFQMHVKAVTLVAVLFDQIPRYEYTLKMLVAGALDLGFGMSSGRT